MTAPTSAPTRFLTAEELLEWLRARGVVASVESVRRWLAEGALPGYRLGKCWYTPLPLLERWEQGLFTTFSPAMTAALTAIEAGQVQAPPADGTVPFPFVQSRRSA